MVDKYHAGQFQPSSLFYSSSGAVWGGSLMWQLYHTHFVPHRALCARIGDARFVPFCSPPWTANNTEAHSSKSAGVLLTKARRRVVTQISYPNSCGASSVIGESGDVMACVSLHDKAGITSLCWS